MGCGGAEFGSLEDPAGLWIFGCQWACCCWRDCEMASEECYPGFGRARRGRMRGRLRIGMSSEMPSGIEYEGG